MSHNGNNKYVETGIDVTYTIWQTIALSESATETPGENAKYVQNYQQRHQHDVSDAIPVSSFSTPKHMSHTIPVFCTNVTISHFRTGM